MTQPLTDATIALASAAAVPVVTAVVNVVKPFLERLPWADPANPADKPTHDATLQVCNLLVTALATLVEIALFGYLSDPSQLWIVAAQVIFIALGADFNYRGSSGSSSGGAGSVALPAPSVASVASALSAAIPAMEAAPAAAPVAVAGPLHQQWAPSPAPDAATDASDAPAADSALDTPTMPVPVVTPATASASAI